VLKPGDWGFLFAGGESILEAENPGK